MEDPDIGNLMRAATERQLAVAALQKKYEASENATTEQLVRDMRDLLAVERVVLDAIITLFLKANPASEHAIHTPPPDSEAAAVVASEAQVAEHAAH